MEFEEDRSATERTIMRYSYAAITRLARYNACCRDEAGPYREICIRTGEPRDRRSLIEYADECVLQECL